MRLPEDRKERIKVLILVGVGTIAVIYALIVGVMRPMANTRRERQARIEELNEQLEDAQRDMSRMLRDRQKNVEVLKEIVEIAARDGVILQPRLGNYELGAVAFIEQRAAEAGVKVNAINEIGITQIPKNPQKKTENAIKAYNMRISLEAGVHDLIRLLASIEDANPYIAITRIDVQTRMQNPARHSLTFELQWPVWSDPTTGETLETQLQEAIDFKRPGGARPPEGGNDAPAI